MTAPTADVQAIAYLLKRERYLRDTAQWDLCRATFHPDAAATYISVAWYQGNVEDFLLQSAKTHRGKVNIVHSSFDPVNIHVRDDRATSEAFCLVTSSLTIGSNDYELASHMRLFSRLQRLPGTQEWRILSLESSYVRDRIVTAFPYSTSEATSSLVITDEVQAYPRCYRHLALVMLHRGLHPRTDLPHEDAPESISQIVDRNRVFLEGGELGITKVDVV